MSTEAPKPNKKALRAAVKAAQAALTAAEHSEKYPSQTKVCRYCKITFKTKATYNGQHQEFCVPAHRKAFNKEGQKPIGAILKRQEKHMRQIAREEIKQSGVLATMEELEKAIRIYKAFSGEGPIGREAAQSLIDSFSPCKPGVRTEQHPTVKPASQQSA